MNSSDLSFLQRMGLTGMVDPGAWLLVTYLSCVLPDLVLKFPEHWLIFHQPLCTLLLCCCSLVERLLLLYLLSIQVFLISASPLWQLSVSIQYTFDHSHRELYFYTYISHQNIPGQIPSTLWGTIGHWWVSIHGSNWKFWEMSCLIDHSYKNFKLFSIFLHL